MTGPYDEDVTRIQPDVTNELIRTTEYDQAKQILDVMWGEVNRTERPAFRGYQRRFLINPSIMIALRNVRGSYGNHVVHIVDEQEFIFGIPVTLVTNYKPWQLVVEV